MQEAFSLLTDYLVVTCGTLPAPIPSLGPEKWARGAPVPSKPAGALQTCCPGVPVLAFKLQVPLLVTRVLPSQQRGWG